MLPSEQHLCHSLVLITMQHYSSNNARVWLMCKAYHDEIKRLHTYFK